MIPDWIIRCDQWGATPARQPATPVGRPQLIVFHHTAGHAPAPGLDGARAYARAIQAFHMGPERLWNDSGHNFLVTRSGHVLEGRHGSAAAIDAGRMIISAHCPGQNDQPGIEHEHQADEQLTPEQLAATIHLHAWICQRTGIRPTAIHGHGDYYPTSCPSTALHNMLPQLRHQVAQTLTPLPRPRPIAQLPAAVRLRLAYALTR